MKHNIVIPLYILIQICILPDTISAADTSCKEPKVELHDPSPFNPTNTPYPYQFFTGAYNLQGKTWKEDHFEIPRIHTENAVSITRYTAHTGEIIDEYDSSNRGYYAKITYPKLLQAILILRKNPGSIVVQYPNKTKVKILTKESRRIRSYIAAGSQIMLQSSTGVLTHHYTAGTRDSTGLIYGDGTQETIYPDQSRKIIFGARSHNPKDFTLGAGTIAHFYRNRTISVHFAPGTTNHHGEPVPYTQQNRYHNGNDEIIFPSGKKIVRHPNGDTTHYETNGEVTTVKRRD